MEMQNNGVEGNTDESLNNEEVPQQVESYDPRAEIESLKQYNEQLLNKLSSIEANLNKPKEAEITPEQYQQLFQTNPAKAIELAVDKTVKTHLGTFEKNIETKTNKQYYDSKTESEFPLIKTDKQFQREVSDKVKELVGTGEYHKDSPTLVWRAAQLAAANYAVKKPQQTTKGISSEAPSNVKQTSTTSKVDQNKFEMWSQIFGLSDDSKKRVLEKMAQGRARK